MKVYALVALIMLTFSCVADAQCPKDCPCGCQIDGKCGCFSLTAQGQAVKQTIYFFCSPMCPPCIQMKSSTLTDAAVKAELAKYDVWYVDTSTPQGSVDAQACGVTLIPTYMVGTETAGKLAIDKRGTGYLSPAGFLQWLNPPPVTYYAPAVQYAPARICTR